MAKGPSSLWANSRSSCLCHGFFPAIEILKSGELHVSVNLVYLLEEVCLVYLVYLVGLVCPVDLARAIS